MVANAVEKHGGILLYNSRLIRSVYFDTKSLGGHVESEEGITPRRKVRIRSYPNSNENFYNIEIKSTMAYGRKKISMPMSEVKVKHAVNYGINVNRSYMMPVLEVQYLRSYFQIDEIRITIDQNIRFKGLNKLSGSYAHLSDLLVVEAKTSDYNSGVRVLSSLGLSLRRFSKYCTGINLIK